MVITVGNLSMTSFSESSSLETFPLELLLEIFIDAISQSKGTYFSLLLVSKRIHNSICINGLRSFMKHPLVLNGQERAHAFSTLLKSQPYLGDHIRHLWLFPIHPVVMENSRGDSVQRVILQSVNILKACSNLTTLGCHVHILRRALLTGPSHPKCQELILAGHPKFGRPLTRIRRSPHGKSFLEQITHLRLMGDYPDDEFHFPNLTHLSFPFPDSDSIRLCIRNKGAFPQLKKLIVTHAVRIYTDYRFPNDRRIFVKTVAGHTPALELHEWLNRARGQTGIWGQTLKIA